MRGHLPKHSDTNGLKLVSCMEVSEHANVLMGTKDGARWHLTLATITKINVITRPMLLSLCSQIKCPFEQRGDHSLGCCYCWRTQPWQCYKQNLRATADTQGVLMVGFDEMAQREEIGALGRQRLYNQLLFIITCSGSVTCSAISIVTGVRKHLCDTCRKFKFPFGAVCILF